MADERQKSIEDDLIFRALDSIAAGDVGRYMLVRNRSPASLRPYAAVFLRENEDPGKVASDLNADVLELSENGLPETKDRLEKERDRLNVASEVMDS